MAIIYSYPEKTSPAGGDFLVITDSEQPAPNKNRTKSLTIDNLANYVVTSVDAVTGSGTTNTLPVWTDGPNGVLGDSMITQNSNGSIATVAGRLAVNTDLSVTGYARFNGQVQDGSNSPGTTGQVLTSTGTGVAWDDAADVVSGAVANIAMCVLDDQCKPVMAAWRRMPRVEGERNIKKGRDEFTVKTRYGLVASPFAEGSTVGVGDMAATNLNAAAPGTNEYYRKVRVANLM